MRGPTALSDIKLTDLHQILSAFTKLHVLISRTSITVIVTAVITSNQATLPAVSTVLDDGCGGENCPVPQRVIWSKPPHIAYKYELLQRYLNIAMLLTLLLQLTKTVAQFRNILIAITRIKNAITVEF